MRPPTETIGIPSVDAKLDSCETFVPKPSDSSPIRSPQAVHTAMLAFLVGKEVVEIGTRKGDGMRCFARVASRAFAVEMDKSYCAFLGDQSLKLSREHRGASFKVLCGDYRLVQGLDGDVITWWQQDPFLRNFAILNSLRSMLDAGRIRRTAKAIFLLDPKYPVDVQDHRRLRKSGWWKTNVTITVPFNEKAACVASKKVKLSQCERARGHFLIVVVPIMEVPRNLKLDADDDIPVGDAYHAEGGRKHRTPRATGVGGA